MLLHLKTALTLMNWSANVIPAFSTLLRVDSCYNSHAHLEPWLISMMEPL